MMRSLAAAAVMVAAAFTAAPLAVADDVTPPEGSTPAVGMAYVPSQATLWLAGPEANEGVVVSAEDGRTVAFAGEPRSVQALASFGDQLWVGDIGDEDASRESITVFRLKSLTEPRSTYHSFEFTYEDGPHDARAMMISGRGRIYVVTSGDDPGIYRAELEPSRERVNKLTRVVDAPPGVTDGVFLADGSTLALRTADAVVYYDAWSWDRLVTHTIVGAPADESIAADPDNNVYVGGNPAIRQMSVPSSDETTSLAPEPEPADSTQPEASPVASGEPDDAGPAADAEAPGRSGTMIALALAGAVALSAGLVAFVKK